MDTQWKNFLSSTKVTDLLGNQKIVTANSDCSIRDCLKLLKEKDVTGFPVLDQSGKPQGLVDVLDITAYAVFLWRNYAHSEKFNHALESTKFFDTKLSKIINFSGRNPWIFAREDNTLLDCLEKFRSKLFKCHRLPILDNNGNVVKMLSMWDIMNFGTKNFDKLGFMNKPLMECPGVIHPCIMLRHSNTLFDALVALVDNGISGLAIVDWENKLEANFSASDLKGLLPEVFDMFDKPVIDFLRQTQTKTRIPPISLPNTANFGDLLKTMTSEKIHRIFLNDRSGRFYGIASCTDVVQSLTPKLSSQIVTSE